MNYEDIYKSGRTVYALDLIGFAMSSRPPIHKYDNCDDLLVESIEQWRIAMNIQEKFILLGHSFGGYIAGLYSFKHHDKLAHVILADPWGISNSGQNDHVEFPF